MIQATCIDRLKNNNSQYRYKLLTSNNQVEIFNSDELKKLIKNYTIEVDNLTLSKDNRLILTKSKKNTKTNKATKTIISRNLIESINCNKKLAFKTNVDISKIKAKSSLLDDNIIVNKIQEGIFKIETPDSILIVTNLNKLIIRENSSGLFAHTRFRSIDLTNLDTSSTYDFSYMFAFTNATSLNLATMDTSKATTMKEMFYESNAQSLDLSNFKTNNVTDMSGMFRKSSVKELKIDKLDTHNVKNMQYMFEECNLNKLSLHNFNTSKVEVMYGTFSGVNIHDLDISNFDYKSCETIAQMFYEAKIYNLYLGNMNLSDVKFMYLTFESAHIHKIIATQILIFNTHNKETLISDKSYIDNWDEVEKIIKIVI